MYYWLPKWTNYNLKRHLQGFPYIGYKSVPTNVRAWSVATHLKFLQIVGISELPFWKTVYWIYPRYPFFVIRGSGKSGVLECVGQMYPLCSFMLSSTWKSSYIYVNQSFENGMHKATSQNSYQIDINILDWFKCVLNKKMLSVTSCRYE